MISHDHKPGRKWSKYGREAHLRVLREVEATCDPERDTRWHSHLHELTRMAVSKPPRTADTQLYNYRRKD